MINNGKHSRLKNFVKRKPKRRHGGVLFSSANSKRWRRGTVIAAALILLTVILFIVNGEPQLLNSPEVNIVVEKGVLTVGVLDGVPGFSCDGEGLEIELGRRLADRILPGMRNDAGVSFVTVTSTSVGAHLDDGSIDVAIALMKKDQSSKYAYSIPYYIDEIRLAVRKGDTQRRVDGMTMGYVFEGKSMSVPGSLKVLEEKNNVLLKGYAAYTDMLNALNASKIDGAVIYGVYTAKYKEEYGFELSNTALGSAEYSIASASDSPAFIEIANIMLNELKEKGDIGVDLP